MTAVQDCRDRTIADDLANKAAAAKYDSILDVAIATILGLRDFIHNAGGDSFSDTIKLAVLMLIAALASVALAKYAIRFNRCVAEVRKMRFVRGRRVRDRMIFVSVCYLIAVSSPWLFGSANLAQSTYDVLEAVIQAEAALMLGLASLDAIVRFCLKGKESPKLVTDTPQRRMGGPPGPWTGFGTFGRTDWQSAPVSSGSRTWTKATTTSVAADLKTHLCQPTNIDENVNSTSGFKRPIKLPGSTNAPRPMTRPALSVHHKAGPSASGTCGSAPGSAARLRGLQDPIFGLKEFLKRNKKVDDEG